MTWLRIVWHSTYYNRLALNKAKVYILLKKKYFYQMTRPSSCPVNSSEENCDLLFRGT